MRESKNLLFAFCFTSIAAALSGCAAEESAPVGYEAPVRDSRYTEVTDRLGPLVVYATGEETIDAEATQTQKPWSGWWLPSNSPYLFRRPDGEQAPMQKYDLAARKLFSRETQAAEHERRKYELAGDLPGWAGHCDAWALASMLEPEPVHPVQIDRDKQLSIGDLKALLIKTYDSIPRDALVHYGQRFDPDADDDPQLQDLYPDQFHKFLMTEMFERGRGFILDKDPGTSVWNYPVYKASLRIRRDLSDERVVHVSAVLRGATPQIEDQDIDTFRGTELATFYYTYDLFGDPQRDGGLRVKYGVWTGESRQLHPDFVTVVPERPIENRRPANPHLDPGIVSELLNRSRSR